MVKWGGEAILTNLDILQILYKEHLHWKKKHCMYSEDKSVYTAILTH